MKSLIFKLVEKKKKKKKKDKVNIFFFFYFLLTFISVSVANKFRFVEYDQKKKKKKKKKKNLFSLHTSRSLCDIAKETYQQAKIQFFLIRFSMAYGPFAPSKNSKNEIPRVNHVL